MSGTAGRLSIPTALIERVDLDAPTSPSASRSATRHVPRASSHVADCTSVPKRTCGSTWCSFAHSAM